MSLFDSGSRFLLSAPTALEAIGTIALSVTSEMRHFIVDIMGQVKECLAQRGFVLWVL